VRCYLSFFYYNNPLFGITISSVLSWLSRYRDNQDLSIAGQRAGLAGERSSLFMDQVRIAREMRKADEQRGVSDHLIRHRFLVWENVPGAFSSADGEDFRAVLEEIVRIKDRACHVPRPDDGTWQSAGAIVLGDVFSLAWRVLDAQYWGVAQRRRRIFLVADFGGRAAPQILFEQDSLFGNSAQSGGQRQGAAASTQGCLDDPGGACLTPWDVQSRRVFKNSGTWSACYSGEGGEHGSVKTEEKAVVAFAANQRDEVRDLQNIAGALAAQPGMKQQTFVASFCAGAGPAAGGIGYSEDLSPTLKASESGTNMVPAILCLNDQGDQCMSVSQDISGTLRAQMHSQPLVLANQQGGAEIGEGVCPTITSAAGTSGNNQPVLFENHGIDSRYTGPHEVAPTMSARYGTGGNNQPLISQPDEVICISGNTIDREPENGGNGLGCQADLAYTLTGADRHAVYSRQRSDEFSENDVVATQSARQHKDATDLVCQPYQETVGTIGYSGRKGVNNQFVSKDNCVMKRRKLIRRLTPLECERLQGYPDGWTDIPGASDSARYKALGNSVAIPCVDFVLRGIAYFLSETRGE
ncbi:DNA cytosine methyltransferase, partial [Clostridiales bacterium BAD-6]